MKYLENGALKNRALKSLNKSCPQKKEEGKGLEQILPNLPIILYKSFM